MNLSRTRMSVLVLEVIVVACVLLFLVSVTGQPNAVWSLPQFDNSDGVANVNYWPSVDSAKLGDDTLDTNGIAILEDFNDIVTQVDMGFNDFSGNMGTINTDYVKTNELECTEDGQCQLIFTWDFTGYQEVFTGLFFSLFGLTEVPATFDGLRLERVQFPEHTLDLDNIDGDLLEPGGQRHFDQICLRLSYSGADPLNIRLELKDADNGLRFTRMSLSSSAVPQDRCWAFREDIQVATNTYNLNLNRAKMFVIVIEESHLADGILNPTTGTLGIHQIWFPMEATTIQPSDDDQLLDLLERRTYQYFLDWSSRKPASQDIPQDRSTFGDLLTVGGIGFALPAHVIGAERGWITRKDAAQRVVNVLRILDNPDAYGPERIGKIGYRGWLYHFLGIDGRRKLNYDFESTDRDESLNTVELSTIDTSLAIMGTLAAQSYFNDPLDEMEAEIRDRAQSIYDRVEWDFMLNNDEQQLYLSWKPNEDFDGPEFGIPDAYGTGDYSGIPTNPYTLDYYTDEALMAILLGVASTTHPIPPSTYNGLIISPNDNGLVTTWPGSLFTYQFMPAFMDTTDIPTACRQVNWFNNSQRAIHEAVQYAERNPANYATYGPDAWGISAAEGPFDAYHAYGAPPLAHTDDPEEDGTVTYYGMFSAFGFGAEHADKAIAALRAGWNRNHWHPRFGFPDAFNDDISQSSVPENALRTTGAWQNRALFAIDQGPMLLHIENYRSDLIWRLIGENPNIQRGLERLKPIVDQQTDWFEAEHGDGAGSIKSRTNASNGQTVWLHDGESRSWEVFVPFGEKPSMTIRYSNDNSGPSETVTLTIDGEFVGQFTAKDTGDGGHGWNVFELSPTLTPNELEAGLHVLNLTVGPGDGYGIEIDAVVIEQEPIIYQQVARSAVTSSELPNWEAAHLIDSKAALNQNAWTSLGHTEHLPGAEWASVILDGTQNVTSVRIHPRIDPNNPTSSLGFPQDFVVQYSVDGTVGEQDYTCNPEDAGFDLVNNWRPLLTYTGYPQPPAEWQIFDFNATDAGCIRIFGVGLSQDDYGWRYMQLAEIEVYDGDIKILPIQAVASSALPNWETDHLIDGDVSTAWSSVGHSEHLSGAEWAGVILNRTQTVNRVRIHPRIDPNNPTSSLGFPQDFVVQYSLDGVISGREYTCNPEDVRFGLVTNWRPLRTYTGYPQPPAEWQTFDFTTTEAGCIRIFGVGLSQDNYGWQYMQLAEIEVHSGDTKREPSRAVVSSELPNWEAAHLIDGDISTAWSSVGHSEHLSRAEWASVILDGTKTVSRVCLHPRVNPKVPAASLGFPQDFVIQYSLDAKIGDRVYTCNPEDIKYGLVTNWRPLLTYTGYPQPPATWQTFDFSETEAGCIRIFGVGLSQDDYGWQYMQLAEIEVYDEK